MNTTTLEIIKKLSQQVNLEAINTKDLVKELEVLYNQVEFQEKELENNEKTIDTLKLNENELKIKLKNYEEEFIIPKKEYTIKMIELEKDKFEFETERKWIKKDRENLLEIVKMLTAKFSYAKNENSPNGYSKNESSYTEKPNLS